MQTVSIANKDEGWDSLMAGGQIVLDSSETRYHVVRVAALKRGWRLNDEGCLNEIPELFFGVPLRAGSMAKTNPCQSDRFTPPTDSSWNVVWVDKSVTHQRVAALKRHQWINHFVGMNCIARKASLFKRLMCLLDRCASAESSGRSQALVSLSDTMRCFYPPSFTTALGFAKLAVESRRPPSLYDGASKGSFYIIKPNKGCKGKGILITRKPFEVLANARRFGADADLLVQEYIDKPLCIYGRKFDIRLYVLITSISPPVQSRLFPNRARSKNVQGVCIPLQHTNGCVPCSALEGIHVYVHRRGLVRACTETYQLPDDDNVDCRRMHLTNYAVNKHSSKYTVSKCFAVSPNITSTEVMGQADLTEPAQTLSEGPACESNKWDLDFLEAFLNSLPSHASEASGRMHDFLANGESCGRSVWARVKRRIDECIVLTVLSAIPALRRELAAAAAISGAPAGRRKNCFELLGFDILLRDNLEPVLMEVNHSPSLFCDTELDFSVKQDVISDVFSLLEAHILSEEQALVRTISTRSFRKSHYSGSSSSQELPQKNRAGVHSKVNPQRQLVRSNATGFVQLLPERSPCGAWAEEELERQCALLELASGLS